MNKADLNNIKQTDVVVIGATGKTGRRVIDKLNGLGVPVRGLSRSSSLRFDWNDKLTWHVAIKGASAIYITFSPDLAVPGSTETITQFVDLARELGVQRLVLLSGRGEEEAQRCERVVMNAGISWTVVRSSWFNQNFSEGEFAAMVRHGVIALPAGDVAEPFIDVEDIADVVVTALLDPGHSGEVYEVTGPRLLTFSQVADQLSAAIGRKVRYEPISLEVFNASLAESSVPAELRWLLNYLMGTVLDGRNAKLGDGVQRALGRTPRDFSEFAESAVVEGSWSAVA